VILEAGSGGSTLDWRRVQARIAATTRTCAYDRAGYGLSDPARRPSDARDAADDLHRLVRAGGLGPPPVLVGHSNGGLYVVACAERFPRAVSGLVLVDPGYPGQPGYAAYGLGVRRAADLHAWAQGLVAEAAHCAARARAGSLHADTPGEPCLATQPDLDPRVRAALLRIYATRGETGATVSELRSSVATTDGVTLDDREVSARTGQLGSLPMVVLTAQSHPAPVPGFSPDEQARY